MKSSLASAAAVLSAVLAGPAHSQAYPERAVRFVVGFAAGGPTDIAARTFASRMSEAWGQQMVVENRGGAGGMVAAEAVAKAAGDGYTLLLCGIAHAISQGLYKKLPYDSKRDFVPLSMIGTTPNILVVNPAVPARTLAEFISYLKSNPGRANYGSSGIGASPHLTMELFKAAAGVDLVHVPYKGSSMAMADLYGGSIVALFDNLPAQIGPVKSGKLRALGVTSARRSALLPEVPTIAEGGLPGFEVVVWYGVCAPAATPKAVQAKIESDMFRGVGSGDMQKRLFEQGVEAQPMTAVQFAAYMQAETDKWAKAIRAAGIQPE
jgi:tripartite-type tricarboxylate transporter receptor subunit TctC